MTDACGCSRSTDVTRQRVGPPLGRAGRGGAVEGEAGMSEQRHRLDCWHQTGPEAQPRGGGDAGVARMQRMLRVRRQAIQVRRPVLFDRAAYFSCHASVSCTRITREGGGGHGAHASSATRRANEPSRTGPEAARGCCLAAGSGERRLRQAYATAALEMFWGQERNLSLRDGGSRVRMCVSERASERTNAAEGAPHEAPQLRTDGCIKRHHSSASR